jgi:hypothetical protein
VSRSGAVLYELRELLRPLHDWLQLLTFGEAILLVLLGLPVASSVLELTLDFTWWGLVPALGDILVLALAVTVLRYRQEQSADLQRRRADLISLMESLPTGAPSLAQVPCGCGRHNRYAYVDGQWVASGPAVNQEVT